MLVVLAGGGVNGNRRLLELGHELGGLDQLHQPLLGRGEENLEGLDVRVEPPLFEFGQDPLGVVLVIRRADMMRARGKPPRILAQVLGRGNRLKLRLPVALDPRGLIRVAGKRLRGAGLGRPQHKTHQNEQNNQHKTTHKTSQLLGDRLVGISNQRDVPPERLYFRHVAANEAR